MVGGGGTPPPELNTTAGPNIGASQGLSGGDDIGDHLDYDGRRAVTAGAVQGNPAVSSRWGTAGQGLVSADQVPGILRDNGEEKMPTTRSAGSFPRDNANEDQIKRPHTASGAGRQGYEGEVISHIFTLFMKVG